MKIGGDIFQMDHSFKITKLLAKVGGEKVFEALFTMTNEYGEIRQQFFAHTKGHNDMRHALEKLHNARTEMGQGNIKAFYTDNVVADKAFLEDIFPYLKEGLYNPITSSLPILKIPLTMH
jgi:hypothetical protein